MTSTIITWPLLYLFTQIFYPSFLADAMTQAFPGIRQATRII
jgi:hypothetical protein